MSRVDVIIPCYKYAHFLPKCIESVLSQPVDVRVLIIDDASPDNTEEVGRQIAARDSRVTFRRHEVNQRHIRTYNEGLDWAAGDYTVLLSADDLLTPGALGRAVRLLDAHPEVGFVYGRVIRFSSEDIESPPSLPSEACAWSVQGGRDWLETICRDATNPICSPEVVVRTSLQKSLGGYASNLPHTADLEMWLRFAAYADVGILEADQACYRIHGSNMHVENFSAALTDLQHRKAAFDTLFQAHSEALPDQERLRALANGALAQDALWTACAAFDRNNTQKDFLDLLLDFAQNTCPDIQSLPEYAGLKWRRRLGPQLFPLFQRLKTRRNRVLQTR